MQFRNFGFWLIILWFFLLNFFEWIGEKKLSKVIVPDKWKEGASNTTEGGGRKINENKLLSKKKRSVLFTIFNFAIIVEFYEFLFVCLNWF